MQLLRSPWARDLAAAVALTALTQVEIVLAGDRVSGPVVAQHAAFLVMTASVALRRRAPVVAAAVLALGFVGQTLVGDAPVVGGFLAMLIVLASLGYHASWRRGLIGLAFLLVAATSYDVVADRLVVADLVGNVAIVLMAWVAGRLVRVSTDRRVLAELGRDRVARDAAAAERSRIARDLHDSVAHAVTLMTLQAGGAREQSSDPVVADQLRAIEEGGREALADMHRFLQLLGPSDCPTEAPGLQDLDDLADRVRALGVEVSLDCEVDPAGVPASLSATAYRVVQEALTNSVKHAGGAGVSVVMRVERHVLIVQVCDSGGGSRSAMPGAGRGLVGLRERLALYGGTLLAEDVAGAGWQVVARIPVPRQR